mgnify:FL=1
MFRGGRGGRGSAAAPPGVRDGAVCPNLLQRPRSSRSAGGESLIFRASSHRRFRPGAPLQQIRTRPRPGPPQEPHPYHPAPAHSHRRAGPGPRTTTPDEKGSSKQTITATLAPYVFKTGLRTIFLALHRGEPEQGTTMAGYPDETYAFPIPCGHDLRSVIPVIATRSVLPTRFAGPAVPGGSIGPGCGRVRRRCGPSGRLLPFHPGRGAGPHRRRPARPAPRPGD